MFTFIETAATTILLLLVMIFVLHLIRGDAGDWFVSKFRIGEGFGKVKDTLPKPTTGTDTSTTQPPIPIGENG